MSGFTTSELVAAVSNAGGPGILGAARMSPEQTKDAIRKLKKLVSDAAMGFDAKESILAFIVNCYTNHLSKEFQHQISLYCDTSAR
jgi:NAD(P)H-dependent flavin oxidoreductase YrpB (nitropropane dioxygenase family)